MSSLSFQIAPGICDALYCFAPAAPGFACSLRFSGRADDANSDAHSDTRYLLSRHKLLWKRCRRLSRPSQPISRPQLLRPPGKRPALPPNAPGFRPAGLPRLLLSKLLPRPVEQPHSKPGRLPLPSAPLTSPPPGNSPRPTRKPRLCMARPSVWIGHRAGTNDEQGPGRGTLGCSVCRVRLCAGDGLSVEQSPPGATRLARGCSFAGGRWQNLRCRPQSLSAVDLSGPKPQIPARTAPDIQSAIFAAADVQALSVLKVAREMNVKVPE